jgi:hypothetical protein
LVPAINIISYTYTHICPADRWTFELSQSFEGWFILITPNQLAQLILNLDLGPKIEDMTTSGVFFPSSRRLAPNLCAPARGCLVMLSSECLISVISSKTKKKGRAVIYSHCMQDHQLNLFL